MVNKKVRKLLSSLGARPETIELCQIKSNLRIPIQESYRIKITTLRAKWAQQGGVDNWCKFYEWYLESKMTPSDRHMKTLLTSTEVYHA